MKCTSRSMGIKRLARSFDLWVRSLSSSLIKSCLWTLLLFIRARIIHHPTHPQSSPYNLGKTPFWLPVSGQKIQAIANDISQWVKTGATCTLHQGAVTFTASFQAESRHFSRNLCNLGISLKGEIFPCRNFATGSSWSHGIAALTSRKMLGLKVTSLWVLLHTSLDNRPFLSTKYHRKFAHVTAPLTLALIRMCLLAAFTGNAETYTEDPCGAGF